MLGMYVCALKMNGVCLRFANDFYKWFIYFYILFSLYYRYYVPWTPVLFQTILNSCERSHLAWFCAQLLLRLQPTQLLILFNRNKNKARLGPLERQPDKNSLGFQQPVCIITFLAIFLTTFIFRLLNANGEWLVIINECDDFYSNRQSSIIVHNKHLFIHTVI